MNVQQVWQAALHELQQAMTPATFETWVKNTTALGLSGSTFTLAAPNTFAKEWLDTRFRPQIEATLGRILGQRTTIDVVVEGFGQPIDGPAAPRGRRRSEASPFQASLLDEEATATPNPAEPEPDPVAADDPRSTAHSQPTEGRRNASRGGRRARVTEPLAEGAGEASAFRPSSAAWQQDSRWTFETFIVGPSNRFAFAAAQAVADEPAEAYNPLFIHGGVGLGKTHLLHAIARSSADKGLKVLYVTSEQFTNDLIEAIQRRQNEEFRAAYRSNDVLLVDDVQFLAGKESTQEEFFHTFNHLHGAHRQIVVSSDRPPRAIATLAERLTSRFEWGLIVDVQPPDVETRTAILRSRAARLKPPVPDDVVDFLAQRIQRNVRELEGALTTVAAFARLNGLPLNVETATRALSEVASGRARQIQPAEVVAAVAGHYKVEAKILRGKQRDREIVVPRQVAMYLMREETTASLIEIGRELGGRDHSTVLHGWEKIKTEVEADDRLRRDVLAIRERLLNEGY